MSTIINQKQPLQPLTLTRKNDNAKIDATLPLFVIKGQRLKKHKNKENYILFINPKEIKY